MTSFVVADLTPPSRPILTVSPSVLWPPNNKLVDVVVTATSSDLGDATPLCSIQKITSNDLDDWWQGDDRRKHGPDFVITGPLTARLRAEKNDGRFDLVYSLFVSCRDDAGNVSPVGVAFVTVPHDRGRH